MSSESKDLNLWISQAEEYTLPNWEKLPSIPLYMDQVMMFTGEALELFEQNENQTLLTSSMINNYVKNGVVEHPVHKKYAKEHLAKLIMTSMLKQVLSIQDISVLFSGEENVQTLYEAFIDAQDTALHETAAELQTDMDPEKMRAIALRLAAEANARRAISERILLELAGSDLDAKNKKTSKK